MIERYYALRLHRLVIVFKEDSFVVQVVSFVVQVVSFVVKLVGN